MLLTGKRALVTGASRGIGAAIARTLAAEGADVAITYQNSADLAEQVAADIRAQGRNAIAIKADNGDVAAVQASVAEAAAALGGLDILVNNAGILRIAGVADMAIEDIQALLDVNVRGPIVATQAALKHIGAGGSIISIGSFFAERIPTPVIGIYAATKSALIAFNQALAREVGPKDITANLVQPGSIGTDMNPVEGPFAEPLRAITANGRYGTTDEIANAVAFLASAKARYITGTTLTVDGGAIA